jgi:hypothetical protein
MKIAIKPKGALISFISEKLDNYGGYLITAKTSHIPFTGFPPPIVIRGKVSREWLIWYYRPYFRNNWSFQFAIDTTENENRL